MLDADRLRGSFERSSRDPRRFAEGLHAIGVVPVAIAEGAMEEGRGVVLAGRLAPGALGGEQVGDGALARLARLADDRARPLRLALDRRNEDRVDSVLAGA